ncbi:MAG: enoyl-CoA hydratase [Acidimicrobiia bacterium]
MSASVGTKSSDDVVLVDVSDGIATVTLNRPESRNAINRAMGQRLPVVLQELEARDDVGAMILTGADPAFCAGVDLKEFGGAGTEPGDVDGMGMGVRDAEGRLPFRGPFPPRTKLLIGAVNGPAVTGGFELALGCDFLVASERARFADTHARVGVIPGWGLTVMLCQSVGVRRARELSATGNYLNAEQALTWGLVNHVVPHDELLPFTRTLALGAVHNDRAAVSEMLRLYDAVADTTVGEGWEIEAAASRAWEGAGFDPAEIEARRAGIVERGRSQLHD